MKVKPLFVMPFLALLTSCMPGFYQIATISSDYLQQSDNGCFISQAPEYKVKYSFWESNGSVRFVFQNTSDDDIYIDMSRSFLIMNGIANDYYQKRTWSNSVSTSSSSAVTATNGRSFSKTASGKTIAQPSIFATLGITSNYMGGVIASEAVTNSSTLTTEEKEGIWVPAHSSKTFCEFSIMDSPFRECGFNRFPDKKDTSAKIEFIKEYSPVQFTNRLMLKINGEDVIVVDEFYVSELKNLNENDALYSEYEVNCKGNKSSKPTWYMKDASPDKFYIHYVDDGSGSSDKTNKQNSESGRHF